MNARVLMRRFIVSLGLSRILSPTHIVGLKVPDNATSIRNPCGSGLWKQPCLGTGDQEKAVDPFTTGGVPTHQVAFLGMAPQLLEYL